MKNLRKFDFIIIAILTGMVALLDIVGVIGLPTGVLSVSSLYIAAAFYLLFIAAFNWRGAIAVYLGLLLSSIFTTGFSIMPLILAWGNVIAPFFIVWTMKKLNLSFNLGNIKESIIEIILMLIAPFISAFWILGGYVLFQIIPASSFVAALIPWVIGNIVVYLVIAIPLMKFVLPLFQRFKL